MQKSLFLCGRQHCAGYSENELRNLHVTVRLIENTSLFAKGCESLRSDLLLILKFSSIDDFLRPLFYNSVNRHEKLNMIQQLKEHGNISIGK